MTREWWIVIGLVAIGAYLVKTASSGVTVFAEAIAFAEGFGTPGAIPTVRNNPGDLRWTSADITTFATVAEGWAALYTQLGLIVSGTSAFYTVTMSVLDMANAYAPDNPSAWAANVVSYLNAHGFPTLTIESPLSQVLL